MKIATFNINGINTKLPSLLEWLATESPDVVCLQELKATLAPKLVESGVDRWVRSLPKPSDHAPAWVTIDVATRGPSRGARRKRG